MKLEHTITSNSYEGKQQYTRQRWGFNHHSRMDEVVQNTGDEDNNGSTKKNSSGGVPAKGILKSSQQSDSLPPSQSDWPQSLISGHFQPLVRGFSNTEAIEGNNTTSRIDTLALQEKGNRRVSFAPDVTLHSFDFVPETRVNLREPRRKAAEFVATSTQQDDSDEENETTSQPMDLTSPVVVSKQPYKPVFDQEVSMEITQLFAKHDEEAENEETMDFTGIPSPAVKSVEREDAGGNTMDFTAIHDSKKEGKVFTTPPSSKKRKLNPEVIASEHESSDEQDMELSIMERMSPISFKPAGPKLERTQTHFLKNFISETGISFLIDTDLIEKKGIHVSFETLEHSEREKFRINQLLNALYLDTPILEMNAFICKELLRRVQQSKKQFDDLDEQISTSQPPPLLFTEYFGSSQEMRQLMNEQLQLVKSYSKLEAKKSWYEWRSRHLNGIKTVLHENLSLLEEDRANVRKSLTGVQEIRARAEALRKSIKKEVELLKELSTESYQEEPSLDERLKMETLRQALAQHSVDIGNAQQIIDKNKTLKEEVEIKKARLADLRRELQLLAKDKSRLKRKNFSEYDIKKCRNRLRMLGIISGVHFERYTQSELTLSFPYINFPLVLSVNLSNLNGNDLYSYQVVRPREAVSVFDHCYRFALRGHSDVSHLPLFLFIQAIKRSITIMKILFMLKLAFPVQIETSDKGTTLRIKDYDSKACTKATYLISFDDFVQSIFKSESRVSVKATIVDKARLSASTIPSIFTKKIARIMPSFDESRVSYSVTEKT